MPKSKQRGLNRYQAIILCLFEDHYIEGVTEFEFSRDEVDSVSTLLKIKVPKNIGDIFYSFRYRHELPQAIKDKAAEGFEWIINGRQFIVPVQAKGGNDRHAVVQTHQDITYCVDKFPDLICRAVSAQFMDGERIAMFELILQDDEIRVVEEKHYQLVSSANISLDDLRSYRNIRQN